MRELFPCLPHQSSEQKFKRLKMSMSAFCRTRLQTMKHCRYSICILKICCLILTCLLRLHYITKIILEGKYHYKKDSGIEAMWEVYTEVARRQHLYILSKRSCLPKAVIQLLPERPNSQKCVQSGTSRI